ncbi:hypothetical protein Bca52824_016443 [Brassica carinata]|uniref:Agenet domain-containing protein n=1 Tax=Brassica carinata TaxID=52824 RepID=A0A8X8B5E3_BRACI|nr:hypothetical protein Bca52824_016443 [Brassica carinata]
MMGNEETSQASASIEEESVNTKMNRIIEVMEENLKTMKDRMSLLEEENMQLKARVSELEGNQNVGPHTQTVVFPTNLTQQIVRETLPSESLAAQTQVFQKETNETPASPKSIETQVFTPIQKQQEDTHVVHNTPSSPISSLISLVLEENKNALPSDEMPSEQNQAEENLQDTTEPTTETQPLNQQTKHLQTSAIDFSETEKVEENRLPILFEIGTDVEIASNDDTTSRIWYPAKVVDLNGVEKVTVEYYRTVFSEKKKVQNTITTEKIRLAPPTSFQKAFEMNDNVEGFYKNGWYSGKIKMVLGDNTYSVYLNSSMETIQFEPSHFRIHREWIDGVWKIADEQKPNKKRKAAGSSQELGKDTVVPLLRRSERVPKRSRDTKTPFKSERNPALTVKREIISAVDPFSTPTDHKFQRLQNLLTSTGGVHGLLINKNVTRKSFFQYIENEGKDLRAVHIDGAFAMLNCRRNENAAWFHNNKIPKAYFLPTTFFPTLGYYIDLIETRPAEGKKIFADGQTELIWKTLDWNSRRLEKRTITLFHCGLPTEDKNNDISQIEELAVLIPALMMEAFGEELKVTCILPPIPHDPEADVCIEDIADKCLEDIADLSKRDYKFKIREWDNMSIDLYAANEEIRRASLLFGNGEMGQASSSYPEESVESKINRNSQMVEDNFRIMNTRLCLIEKDSKEIKTEESRVQTLFEVGENVEIASGRKWYPGNVLKTYMLNGVEMVTVEYSTLFLDKKKMTKRLQESVSSDRIHPQQPSEKLGERKSFELMDKVEAYHNDGWCSGQVRMILNDDTYSVNFNRSTESIKFSLSDLRIPKEWVDGVWKTAKEMEEQQAQSVKPSQEDRAKKGKAVVGKKRRTVVLPEDVVEKMEKEMEEQQAQSVKPSQDDHEKEGKAVVGKKRKATAQPVDLLPFLQREEKRPIGPRNPPMPVTLEVILPIDPFVTPEFPRFSRLGYWMELRGIHCVPFYINGREKEKDFFEYMDNAENNLKEEE